MKKLSQKEKIGVALAVVVVSVYLIIPNIHFNPLENLINEEIMEETREGGLVIRDLEPGSGDQAVNGNTISVHYRGTLEDGTQFDSSIEGNVPFEFTLGAGDVIAGWDQGVLGMRVGGKRTLIIPPALGYGELGIGPIPGNATLIFEIELLEIK